MPFYPIEPTHPADGDQGEDLAAVVDHPPDEGVMVFAGGVVDGLTCHVTIVCPSRSKGLGVTQDPITNPFKSIEGPRSDSAGPDTMPAAGPDCMRMGG